MAASLNVVALHGFTGSGADFGPLTETLPEYHWITPTLPGHAPDLGAPGSPGDDCSLEVSLRYLDSVMPSKTGLPTVLLGYSLGGRLALRYALKYQDMLAGLVIIGASPGITEPAERAARQLEDEKLAQIILRDGVGSFIADWLARPLIATQQRLPMAWREAMRERKLRLRKEGLAASLRQFGQGAVEPVLNQLSQLRLPVLLAAGAEDEKYAAQTRAMQAQCPPAELLIVPEAGHLAHLENLPAFALVLRAFLQKIR